MDNLFCRELDFVLEPTYTKINKVVNIITNELIDIVGKQYSNIINDRILHTNFVFFNKITDLNNYCKTNSKKIESLNDKKLGTKYENIIKSIQSYDNKINKLYKHLRIDFIKEIQSNLSDTDQNYLNTHQKIDLKKLNCYPLFFSENSSKLIDGIIMCFSLEYEKKLKDKTTAILEMETIFNNRERCLELLGIQNTNVRCFKREKLNDLFDIIDKYNREYVDTINSWNVDAKKIINEFLLSEKLLNNKKNAKASKYFLNLLKKDKQKFDNINNKIISRISKINEPEILWTSDECSDDKNIRFFLFSPTMDCENNDFLFVKWICRLAFNSENYNNKSIVNGNSIIGKDKYLMFSNLIIDTIAYQITKKLYKNDIMIINLNKTKDITEFNNDLFLVDKFYQNYSNEIIESLINNNKRCICDVIGSNNFENFVNIINKYFYDCQGNLLSKEERNMSVFATTIKNILKISLENMEQYQRILINKDKYSI